VLSRKLSNVLKGLMGWVTKIYYLELLRALEGTLNRWSRLHLQSLAPIPVSKRVDVRQAAGRKNNSREKGRKKKSLLKYADSLKIIFDFNLSYFLQGHKTGRRGLSLSTRNNRNNLKLFPYILLAESN
jgi:hypothetical protein